jgi:hypothetical protein
MSALKNCPFCSTPTHISETPMAEPYGRMLSMSCPQCGTFHIASSTAAEIKRRNINPAIASAWIRQKNDQSQFGAHFEDDDVDRLAALQFPSFKERMESYLLAAAGKSSALQATFPIHDPPLLASAYCTSRGELEVITEHLKVEGHLLAAGASGDERNGLVYLARLTPKGHMYADELRTHHTASSQGFIAMWFDKTLEAARRDGFEVGIRDAGYKPHRVDDAQYIDRIDDRIIAEIRRSRFVVADLTGHRGGVYYEAGFAAGLGKPVFYTCRKDHAKDVHFDIRQFNCILWDTSKQLAADLRARIEAVLGTGPETTP